MQQSNTVLLALGSNLGNKEQLLQGAVNLLTTAYGEVIAVSSFYKTEPEGFESLNSFVNMALVLETCLSPLQLLQATEAIERQMGRKSKSERGHYSDRPIDIDIILYEDVVMDEEYLTLPHPRFRERLFVLDPAVEIAAEMVDPITKKTIRELRWDA